MNESLTRNEISDAITVLLKRGSYDRRRRDWRNDVCIFALVTCCGFTPSQIAALNMCNIQALNTCKPPRSAAAPYLFTLNRFVPLDWHKPAGDVIAEHYRFRLEQGAAQADSLLATVRRPIIGKRLSPSNINTSYAKACELAGFAKPRRLSTVGVESFMRNAIAAGIEPAAVRGALGQLMPGEQPRLSPQSRTYIGLLERDN